MNRLTVLSTGLVLMAGLIGCRSLPTHSQTVAASQAETALLERLSKQNSPLFFHRRNASGAVNYLVGTNLFPQCVSSEASTDRSNARLPAPLLGCLQRELQPLFRFSLDEMTSGKHRIASSSAERGNRTMVTYQQTWGQLPVKNGRLEVTLGFKRRITRISGQWIDPSLIDGIEVNNNARSVAENRLGLELDLSERFVDVGKRSVISVFTASNHDHLRYQLNESTGLITSMEPLIWRNHALVEKSVRRAEHTNRSDVSQTFATASVAFDTRANGSDCELRFDQGASHHDNEPFIVLVKDKKFSYSNVLRVPGNCLPGEFIDIAPPHQDLTSVYFWHHDLAQFSNHPVAAYNAELAWTERRAKPVRVAVQPNGGACGQLNQPGCAIYGGKTYTIQLSRSALNATLNLGVIAHEFGHVIHQRYGFEPDTYLGRAVAEGFAEHNVMRHALYRRQLNDQRDFDRMDVLSYESPIGRANSFEEVSKRGQLTVSSDVYNVNTFPCNASASRHTCGFILSRVYWELVWNQCRVGYKNSLGGGCREGQLIIQPKPDWSFGTSTAVDSEAILRELGDQAVSTIPQDQLPIDTPIAIDAVALANAAFTHAIAAVDSDATPQTFMDEVHHEYLGYLQQGRITLDDFLRAWAVMGHHCLGFESGCETERILPGHKLPIGRTYRLSLDDSCDSGSCEQLSLTQEMDASETVIQTPFVDGLEDERSVSYATLDQPSDLLDLRINVTKAGFYQLSASVRPLSTGGSSLVLNYRSPDQAPTTCATPDACNGPEVNSVIWPVEVGHNEWGWSNGPVVPLTEGEQFLRLRFRQPLDIEALHVLAAEDRDGDRTADPVDNCPNDPNPRQENLDGDKFGDVCDIDIDGDKAELICGLYGCFYVGQDNCPLVPNQDQLNQDGDEFGNACDNDVDNDGIVDGVVDGFISRLDSGSIVP